MILLSVRRKQFSMCNPTFVNNLLQLLIDVYVCVLCTNYQEANVLEITMIFHLNLQTATNTYAKNGNMLCDLLFSVEIDAQIQLH